VTTAPGNGSLSAITPLTATSAEVTYTPNADFNGADSFSFTVDDGTTTSAPATVDITINPINDDPVANPLSQTTPEDTALTISLTGSDLDNDPLTFSIVTPPSNGTLSAITPINATSAEVTYTPDLNFNGADSFTFQVDDGNGGIATAAVDITIDPANDNPVANPQMLMTNEDIDLPIILTGSDLDNDTLTFSIVTPPSNGTLSAIVPINATSADLTYTPDLNFNGSDSFTFQVDDGFGGTATAVVDITVNPQADVPVANAQMLTMDEDTALMIMLTGSDPDGDTLTFSIVTPPTSGTFTQPLTQIPPTSADLEYTPNADFNGSDSFEFQVDDGNGGTATATVDITINPVNDDPVADPQTVSTDEDIVLTITLTGSDTESVPLSFAIATAPSNGSLSAITPLTDTSASVDYTPNTDLNGADSFTFTVDDGSATSAPATVDITIDPVNDAPVVTTSGGSTAFTEDGGAVTVDAAVTVTDADNTNLASATVTISNLLDAGLETLAATPSGAIVAGNISYVAPTLTITAAAPVADFQAVLQSVTYNNTSNTPDTTDRNLQFVANDGSDNSNTASKTVTVAASNDAPVVTTSGGSTAFTEDGGAVTVDAAVTVTDADSTNLASATVTISNLLDTGLETLAATPSGAIVAGNISYVAPTLTITAAAPVADFQTVLQSVTYNNSSGSPDTTARLIEFLVNDGTDPSPVATSTITINSVNNQPTFTATDPPAVDEDAGAQTVNDWAVFDPGDPDESGQNVQAYTVSMVSVPTLFAAGPSVDTSGNLSYTPADNANGSSTFEVTVQDDGGTANGGIDTSVAQTFTITVTSVNDPPVLGAIGNQSGNELVQISFTATATDPNDTPPDNLSFSLSGEPAGAAIDPNSGGFTWTPTEAQGPGMFTFNVIVTDDGTNPANLTDSETITVTVNEVNLPPVLAAIGNQSGDELTNITFTAMATDPDLPMQALSFSLSGEPAGAAIDPNSGVFTWTPTEAQGPGMFTFDVIVTDNGTGTLSDSETITVTVNEVNQNPVATDDTYAATGNVGINVPAGTGLLFDGTDDSDPDLPAQTLTVTAETVASANGGSATIAADGSFSYTPPAGFTGMNDTFSYTLNDGVGGTATATVTITVSNMIWFIDNSVVGPGTGTLADPFAAIATYEASGLPAAGQCIFIEETGNGDYTGPITLDNNDTLVGNGAAGSIDAECGITLATNSVTLPGTAGTRPVIAHSANNLTLALNNTLRGLNLSNTGGTALIDNGSGFGNLVVSEMSISNSSGTAIDLDTGNPTATFTSVSANGGTVGINIDNAGTTGFFTVTGTGTTDGSGGTIQNTTQNGILIQNTDNISLSNMNLFDAANDGGAGTCSETVFTGCNAAVEFNNVKVVDLINLSITNFDDHGIFGQTVTDLDITNTDIDGLGADVGTNEHGIFILNLLGTTAAGTASVFDNLTIDDAQDSAIRIQNTTATNLGNTSSPDQLSVINSSLTDAGDSGLNALTTAVNGNLNVIVTGNTITNTVDGVSLVAEAGNLQGTVGGAGALANTISYVGGNMVNGIRFVANASMGAATFNGTASRNTITLDAVKIMGVAPVSGLNGVGVSAGGFSSSNLGTIRGTVEDNTINSSFSGILTQTVHGVSTNNEGTGTTSQNVISIDNNMITLDPPTGTGTAETVGIGVDGGTTGAGTTVRNTDNLIVATGDASNGASVGIQILPTEVGGPAGTNTRACVRVTGNDVRTPNNPFAGAFGTTELDVIAAPVITGSFLDVEAIPVGVRTPAQLVSDLEPLNTDTEVGDATGQIAGIITGVASCPN
ncbi:MAG: tandem-95 repeat protein, partial [bacterium]|nr:tandem-95 repeat protein [bacterium]